MQHLDSRCGQSHFSAAGGHIVHLNTRLRFIIHLLFLCFDPNSTQLPIELNLCSSIQWFCIWLGCWENGDGWQAGGQPLFHIIASGAPCLDKVWSSWILSMHALASRLNIIVNISSLCIYICREIAVEQHRKQNYWFAIRRHYKVRKLLDCNFILIHETHTIC